MKYVVIDKKLITQRMLNSCYNPDLETNAKFAGFVVLKIPDKIPDVFMDYKIYSQHAALSFARKYVKNPDSKPPKKGVMSKIVSLFSGDSNNV